MDLKQQSAKIFIYFILILMKGCSHRLSLTMGRWIGRQLFSRMKERAQVAVDNLKLIYGEQFSENERRALARKNFEHLGSSLIEILYVLAAPKRLNKITHITGKENMEQALAKAKGAIIVSGHLGNFFFMGAALCQYFPVRFLYRRPSQTWVARIYDWLLGRLGLQTIADNPRHLCAFHSYSHLKKKGVLGVLIDQVETGGMVVDFMGQPAGSTLGAGNMALKSGAPIVPVFCHRLPNHELKITVEPEFEYSKTDVYEEDLKFIVSGTNKIVENWVRAYPEQWFWGHRRWRKWRK